MTARGLRNNNPGNVRYDNHTLWDGLANPPTDGSFCRFVDPEHGIRVLFKLLLAYQRYHNLLTVRGMIDRWAPPQENDTGAYVLFVARHVGLDPDDPFEFAGARAREFVRAVILQENGENPYTPAQIEKAAQLAGLDPLPPAGQKTLNI